jgi:hypothetical protein
MLLIYEGYTCRISLDIFRSTGCVLMYHTRLF